MITAVGKHFHHFHAGPYCRKHILILHGGFLQEIAGAVPGFFHQQPFQLQIVLHPHIHREYIRSGTGSHPVDTCQALSDISRHHRSDLMTALGYSLFDDPIVRTHDHHRLFFQSNVLRPLNGRDLYQGILQQAQPVQRLRDGIPVPFTGFSRQPVRLLDPFPALSQIL